ncbi:Pectinesterase, catalytic [Corchorus olitorius]|uniref:Pectinesterase n=1 Tax=Corchorus olitorius TaxID=93759 RepID=A0A1R3IUV9_9ROSI|nr:Pectinesterase, catalytic [Corchorus olitorius]
MAQELTRFTFFTTLLTTLLALQLIPTVISHNNAGAPAPYISPLDMWIAHNIKEHEERKPNIAHGPFNRTVLDKALIQAEEGGIKLIKVKKDGGGDFDTLTAAVDSIPFHNKQRVVVWIGGGEYFEKIAINQTKDFVLFYGEPSDMPKIVYNGTAAEFGTVNSATVVVESDYFIAVNIIFVNSAPMPDGNRTGEQAVAMRISGDKAAFHNCKFLGFQDTLCDDRGMHFFKDCYVEGTVDFIFGNGKSLYLNTTIKSVAKNIGVVTAQARETVGDESGFAFLYCNITGEGNSTTYLGRAWKLRPRVIFAYSYMGTIIKSEGWSTDKYPERNGTVYYGEYKCKGPGASLSGRVGYAKILQPVEIIPFLSLTYIHGSNWLLPPPKVEMLNHLLHKTV